MEQISLALPAIQIATVALCCVGVYDLNFVVCIKLHFRVLGLSDHLCKFYTAEKEVINILLETFSFRLTS